MWRFTLNRMAFFLPSIFGVITLCFLLVHLVPGDPADYVLGDQADRESKAIFHHELGLDLPLPQQYARYLHHLAKLDLGRSLHNREAVAVQIANAFPATLELALAAVGIALLWGLPLGVWSAASRSRFAALDFLADALGLIGMSVPGVFLGPALIYIFAMRLDWLPVSERGGWDHLVLPAISLALPLGSVILRMTRAAMMEVISEDYIRTAKAKGASPNRIYFRHALRNALIPIVTVVGLQLGAMLTGTVITETIFDWPGLGTLLYGSIQRRDYPVVQGCVLVIACIYVVVNLLTDLAYGLVDPRVETAET